MESRIKVKSYTLSREELEDYLIKYHGEPEDIVITGIDKVINQEAWLVKIQSNSYNALRGKFDLLGTMRNDLLTVEPTPRAKKSIIKKIKEMLWKKKNQ